MSTLTDLVARFTAHVSDSDEATAAAMRPAFVAELPQDVDGGAVFDDIAEAFSGEELAQVAAETVAMITASCTADDFHNWDYDHLEFLIELSNRRSLTIPRNLLNGLPEQLILLVKRERLSEPGCD